MHKFLIFLILLVFADPAYAHTYYKWVNDEGVVNYTDNYNNVPSSYRERVEIKDDLTEVLSYARPLDIPIRAEAKTDIYGRDETWWREKTRPWREQLKGANENYEKVHEEFMKHAERLVRVKFGSKTQYQMVSYVLSGLTQQLEEYRGQIAKAEKMLDELSKEAEKAKANPKWLAPESDYSFHKIFLTKKEEIEMDLYSRDKTWKEKVRTWQEQSKLATENYGKVQEKFVRQGEGLGPVRFGGLSLTQYQMISSRLIALSDRMTKYQTQIAEANEMVEKLSKEAKKTKTDSTWFE